MARMITRQEAANLLDVSAQTISNWVEKGILNSHNSCDGRNTMLIDRKSIEKYFDSLEDLAFMEKRISLQRKSLKEETDALEGKIHDMSTTRYLFGRGISEYLLRDIFNCIIEVAGDSLLVEREKSILQALIDGRQISELSEDYYLTSSRIMQIVNKGIHKVSTMKKWPEWHKDYKRLADENYRLSVLLDNQQTRIKHLEVELNIVNTDGGESAVPGYSKLELAEVLGRRLVDENLTVRSLNCLKAADIETVSQLVRYCKTDLLKFRNFGKKSLMELDAYLDSIHLSFGMDIDSIIDAEVEEFLKQFNEKRK